MCLILFALRSHPNYSLIVAANRDEYYARPTKAAAYWDDHPNVLAGRDLEQGGSWFAINQQGRFAAVTNFRTNRPGHSNAASRGELVTDYVTKHVAPETYVDKLDARKHRYNGFCLLVGNPSKLWFCSNHSGSARELPAGLYGLSNALLDTPWPKVVRGKAALAEMIAEPRVEADGLLNLLRDDEIANDALLPNTGIGLAAERAMAPLFVSSASYGTRCSTVLMIHSNGTAEFTERSYASDGRVIGDSHREFELSTPLA